MLASITPLGERGRRSNWAVTAAAFAAGALAAGAALGAVIGALGALVVPAGATPAALIAALAGAILLDARAPAAPGPRRQVDERWLHRYRGWVYGLGYGAQLGAGVTTIVSSAATYVALIAALLSGGAPRGAVIVGVYGAVRGVTPLAAARVRSTGQLVALHRAIAHWRGPARLAGCAALIATLAAAVLWGVT